LSGTIINKINLPDGLYTETVLPEWIDGNGHMSSSYYLLAFDQSAVA